MHVGTYYCSTIPVYTALQLYSCTRVQLYSCTAVQLYSDSVQLYSCTAVQLYSFTATAYAGTQLCVYTHIQRRVRTQLCTHSDQCVLEYTVRVAVLAIYTTTAVD